MQAQRIPLRDKDGVTVAHTTVDPEDYDELSRYSWHLGKSGYATRSWGSGQRLMHRFILGLGVDRSRIVDHINRDPLDNRRANLRIGTNAENCQNTVSRPGSSSRYRNVHYDRERNRWCVTLRVSGKSTHFGYFRTEGEANEAAMAARAKHMPHLQENP